MSPFVVAAMISASGTVASAGIALTGVLFASRRQTSRIDRDNRAALADQTGELKQHLGKEQP